MVSWREQTWLKNRADFSARASLPAYLGYARAADSLYEASPAPAPQLLLMLIQNPLSIRLIKLPAALLQMGWQRRVNLRSWKMTICFRMGLSGVFSHSLEDFS